MQDRHIRLWQWPNLLAVDAAIIAAAWMAVFATRASAPGDPGITAYLVLAASVWLTYMADRLFDVSGKPLHQLASDRHHFAKRHTCQLWCVWLLVLGGSVLLAAWGLSPEQFKRGAMLLIVALIYTALNRLCSKRFFPKELLVAIIFTAGTQVFLNPPVLDLAVMAFALLCLSNCLIIADRERSIDARLQVCSLTRFVGHRTLPVLITLCLASAAASQLRHALLPSAFGLTLAYTLRRRFPLETFRVLADTFLLLGPLVVFLWRV